MRPPSIVPPGWVEHHRPTVEGFLLDRCVIREPDSWAGETLTEGGIAWQYGGLDEIPCRIQVDESQPLTTAVGGQEMQATRLIIALPIGIEPTDKQVITIAAATSDPSLVGLRYDVQAHESTTYTTDRRVRCTLRTY